MNLASGQSRKNPLVLGNDSKNALTQEEGLRFAKDLINFSSPFPIAILEIRKKEILDQRAWQVGFLHMIESSSQLDHRDGNNDATGKKRSLIVGPVTVAIPCGLKRRGSSTIGYPKYSLAIEARGEGGDDKPISLCGMPAESDWVLGGAYEIDRSLIRDDFVYQLSREIGMYAPRTRFVEVFVHSGDDEVSYAKHYFGVYSLTEKIKRGEKRVQVSRMKESGDDQMGITGGYIFKHDRADPGDQGFEVTGLGKFQWVYPKERNMRPEFRRNLANGLADFSLSIQAPGGRHPISRKHFSELIDERSWLVWHWLNTLTKNIDAYNASAYFYQHRKDRRGGIIGAGPVWDFDRSMNSCDPRDNSPIGWGAPGHNGQTFGDKRSPWWGLMLSDPDFRQKHIDIWQELREAEFSWENLTKIIDGLAAQLQEEDPKDVNIGLPKSPAARNFARWPAMPPRGGNHAGEISILKRWLKQRLAWIDRQFVDIPHFLNSSGQVPKGFRTEIVSPKNAKVYWTFDGSDPRLTRGKVSEKALTAKAFEINSSCVVIARTKKGQGPTAWSAPVRRVFIVNNGESYTSPSLKVTKLVAAPKLAKNQGEQKSEFEPADYEYLELTNPSKDRAVDLTGATFSKGIKFSFDQATIKNLDPGEKLYLCRNIEAFKERYGVEMAKKMTGSYAPYKLDNQGERILLHDGLGRLLVDYEYEREE